MADRRNALTTSSASGVLRPDALAQHVDITRMPCAEVLAPWVEDYWLLTWEPLEGVSHVSVYQR